MSSTHILSVQAVRGDEVLLRVDVTIQSLIGDVDPDVVAALTALAQPIIDPLMVFARETLGSHTTSISSDQPSLPQTRTLNEEQTK